MIWKLCLFCQKHSKQNLTSVQYIPTSKDIVAVSQFDPVMRVHVANEHDLIAAEAKYHLVCYSKRMREKKEQSNIPMWLCFWFCNELKYSAEHGHLLELEEVWQRYLVPIQEADVDVPQSFISRPSTCKEKLEKLVSNLYDIVILHDRIQREKHTVLVRVKFCHIPVSEMTKSADNEDKPKISIYKPSEGN